MIKLKELLIESFGEMTPLQTKTEEFNKYLVSKYPQLEDLSFHSNYDDRVLHLSIIRIKKGERGKGIGREIINSIKQFADENNLIITLSPEPEPRYKKKLDNFYRDSGFIHNRGRKKDYSLSSFYGPTMIRRPGMNEEVDKKIIDVPEPSGTVKIPHNYLRLYHYTKGDPEIIRKEGLKLSNARGNTYGEPNVIWSSTIKPKTGLPIIEFAVPIDDKRITRMAGNYIDVKDGADFYNNRDTHVTFYGDINPSEFIAIHEPWHRVYRYLIKNELVDDVLDGKYDYLLTDKHPDEFKAILAIKKNFGK